MSSSEESHEFLESNKGKGKSKSKVMTLDQEPPKKKINNKEKIDKDNREKIDDMEKTSKMKKINKTEKINKTVRKTKDDKNAGEKRKPSKKSAVFDDDTSNEPKNVKSGKSKKRPALPDGASSSKTGGANSSTDPVVWMESPILRTSRKRMARESLRTTARARARTLARRRARRRRKSPSSRRVRTSRRQSTLAKARRTTRRNEMRWQLVMIRVWLCRKPKQLLALALSFFNGTSFPPNF